MFMTMLLSSLMLGLLVAEYVSNLEVGTFLAFTS
jgi:hypothetical protein